MCESSDYKDGANIGKWDVVGGRVEPGQEFSESLLREVKEETGLAVEIGKPFLVQEWRPIVKGEQWQIVGIYFECFANTKEVTLSQDHDKYEWISSQDIAKYNFIEKAKVALIEYFGLANQ